MGKILKEIKEQRVLGINIPQENQTLIYLARYLNRVGLIDKLWSGHTKQIEIHFIRSFYIYEEDGKLGYGMRYDGVNALGKGIGMNYLIDSDKMIPFTRFMKLKDIMKNGKPQI